MDGGAVCFPFRCRRLPFPETAQQERSREGRRRVFSLLLFRASYAGATPAAPDYKNARGIAGMIQTIVEEMTKGNFSFLILVVGVAQLVTMMRKK